MIDITAGIEGGDWAEKEFGGASLGDERLSQRLVEIAADKAGQPAHAYGGVAEGDWPPEVLFSDIEVEVLRAYAKKKASTFRAL